MTADILASRASRAPAARSGERRARILKPWILLAPALACLGLFTYWPVVSVLVDSLFTRRLGDKTAAFVGLDNYGRLFSDAKFAAAALNNLLYAVGSVVPSIVLALGFALMLKQSNIFNRAMRALLFFPTMVPLIAAAALWTFLFLPTLGLIDYYLGRLLPLSINWLGDPDSALWAITLVTVWKNAGYYMLFYLAALQSMPEELIEAAILDGAGPWQRFRHVILPLLGPTTAFVGVIAVAQAITTVDHVIVMTRGGPNDATTLLLFYIFQTATEVHDPGKAAAATVVTLAILFVVSTLGIRSLDGRGVYAS